MSGRTLADARSWVDTGTQIVAGQLSELGEDDYAAPSGLPGWSRKNLVAHLSGNAEAISNLAHWAATGEPTPMYASPEARNAAIEAGAAQSGADLTAAFAATAAKLAADFDALTDEQWNREVVTGQGRTVPASEIPWMRAREVLVHAVDLQSGVGFDDLPAGFLVALCEDIVGKRSAAAGTTNEGPALEVSATDVDLRWQVAGAGEPAKVAGTLAAVTSYLSGRGAEMLAVGSVAPELPAWL